MNSNANEQSSEFRLPAARKPVMQQPLTIRETYSGTVPMNSTSHKPSRFSDDEDEEDDDFKRSMRSSGTRTPQSRRNSSTPQSRRGSNGNLPRDSAGNSNGRGKQWDRRDGDDDVDDDDDEYDRRRAGRGDNQRQSSNNYNKNEYSDKEDEDDRYNGSSYNRRGQDDDYDEDNRRSSRGNGGDRGGGGGGRWESNSHSPNNKYGDREKYGDRDRDRDGERIVDRDRERNYRDKVGRQNSEMSDRHSRTPLRLDNMKQFLTTSLPRSAGVVQCYIRRNKSGTNKIFPVYSLYLKVNDVIHISKSQLI